MKIRTKLLAYLGVPFLLLTFLSFGIILKVVSSRIEYKLETQLQDQQDTVVNQVSGQVITSSKSYLAGLGDTVYKTVNDIYLRDRQQGEVNDTPQETIKKYLLSHKYMKDGYIFVVSNDGKILVHPNESKIGAVSTHKDWLKSQSKSERTYRLYEYEGRSKLIYRMYFPNLEWNIMVSANVDDFFSIVDKEELNNTLNDIKVGDKGYPFTINRNGFMITHPSPDFRGRNSYNMVDADGNMFIKRIIDEKDGSFAYNWKEEDGSIKEKFIYFKYDKNSKLYVCLSGYTADFYDIVDNILQIILISGIVMILLIMMLLYGISTSVSKPLIRFTKNLINISEGEGDLTSRITLNTRGEIGIMVKTFNSFIESLQLLIQNIKGASQNTISIKDEVSIGVNETASALHEISSNINGIKSQTNHLNQNIRKSSDASDNISTISLDLDKAVEKQDIMLQASTAAITEMISSIDNVNSITNTKQESTKQLLLAAKSGSTDINDTQNAVKEISDKLTDIQEMAEVISNIASQTNLLAMNAAIEAAHAGDAGKGFAVVADEIRKLAEDSSENSNRISDTLNSISTSIASADSLSGKTGESFTVLNREINDMVNALSEITQSTGELQIGGKDILSSISGLEEASQIVKERTSKIKELSATVKSTMSDTSNISLEVVTSIDEINQGVSGISSSMEGVMENTLELKNTSDILKSNVDRFKV